MTRLNGAGVLKNPNPLRVNSNKPYFVQNDVSGKPLRTTHTCKHWRRDTSLVDNADTPIGAPKLVPYTTGLPY